MRGSTTKSNPRNFVMSAGGFTLGVSVTLGASTTDVVFNTALDTALGAVAFLAVAVDLRVRRRVEVVVKC